MTFRRFLLVLLIGIYGFLSAEAQEIPTSRSVCLLKSPQGSGSGFFASFAGKDVLITNNHVILEMKDVKILDINGHIYEYDQVYSSPERDLAIIPLQRINHAEMPNLPICKHPDMLPEKTKVTAYGDSLGAGVIVTAEGKFLGIGPGIVEVDAPFVSGNSGGPILTTSGKQVVGVATYCRIITSAQRTTIGSRFESRSYKPQIRRFATRIDNITLDEFEKLTPEEIKKDQHCYLQLEETFRKIADLLNNSASQSYVTTRLKSILETSHWPKPERWHSTYLQKEAEKKEKLLNELKKIFSITTNNTVEPGRDPKLLQAWQKALPQIKFGKKKKITHPCPVCQGSKWLKQLHNSDNPQKIRTVKYTKCHQCHQTGKRTVREEMSYAVLPPSFSRELAKLIKPETKIFCGFTVGVPVQNWSNYHDGFYKNARMTHQNIFTVLRISGNHRLPDAVETRLWLVGNVLMQVDIILPRSDAQQAQNIQMQIKQEMPEMQHASILYANLRQFKRLEHPPKKDLDFLQFYYWQMREAYNYDPFGIFYQIRMRVNQQVPPAIEAKHTFLQITFRHKSFEECRFLMSMPEINQPSGTANGTGKQNTNMFFTDQ